MFWRVPVSLIWEYIKFHAAWQAVESLSVKGIWKISGIKYIRPRSGETEFSTSDLGKALRDCSCSEAVVDQQ